jgi:hypothetical protein
MGAGVAKQKRQHRLHIRKSPWAPTPLCGATDVYAVIYLDPRYPRRVCKAWRYCAKCVSWWNRGVKRKVKPDRALYWPSEPVDQGETTPYTHLHIDSLFVKQRKSREQ